MVLSERFFHMVHDDNSTARIEDTVYRFLQVKTSKADYIEEMYKKHHSKLFEYSNFISNSNISKIEILDGQVIMTTRNVGAKFICPIGDHRVAPIEILNFLDYEKAVGITIDCLVKDGDNFFDIGANMGWYSVNLALTRPEVGLYCFEPIPQTYKLLEQNLELNGIDGVKTHNFGLSDVPGEFDLFFYKEGSGNASLANLTNREDVERITCRVVTLDNFTEMTSARVDFIKCDVEGAEFKVFKGGLKTISRDMPIVLSEILRKWSRSHGYEPNEIFNLFNSLGYRAFTVLDFSPPQSSDPQIQEEPIESNQYTGPLMQEFFSMDESTEHTNFFFLHRDKHQDLIEQFVSN